MKVIRDAGRFIKSMYEPALYYGIALVFLFMFVFLLMPILLHFAMWYDKFLEGVFNGVRAR